MLRDWRWRLRGLKNYESHGYGLLHLYIGVHGYGSDAFYHHNLDTNDNDISLMKLYPKSPQQAQLDMTELLLLALQFLVNLAL